MKQVALVVALMMFLWLPLAHSDSHDADVEKCFEFRRATGDPDLAIDHCTRVITAGRLPNAKLARIYYKRGNAWAKKRDLDRSTADYNDAIRLKPRYTDAFFNRGQNWYEKHDYDRGIADHNEVVRINLHDGEAIYFRGWGYYSKGQYDQAIADYSEAIRLKPDFDWIYINRGLAWEKQGDLGRAIADFETAIRLNPQETFAVEHRERARLLKGKFAK